MKHENSLPSFQGLPTPKSTNGQLEVSSSSFQSEIVGIPGDPPLAPYRLQRAPEISAFHQAKLYDDDAETDLASEYSRPVFKIPEWNTNRRTWSF